MRASHSCGQKGQLHLQLGFVFTKISFHGIFNTASYVNNLELEKNSSIDRCVSSYLPLPYNKPSQSHSKFNYFLLVTKKNSIFVIIFIFLSSSLPSRSEQCGHGDINLHAFLEASLGQFFSVFIKTLFSSLYLLVFLSFFRMI